MSNTDRYRWATPGDINAFFGLMLDNLAGLLLMVTMLSGFGMPPEFIVSHMIPGTAIGVLVGDLAFFGIAMRLARRTGRQDVTAMPLGLDTPSTFGFILLVLGPSFLAGKASGLDVDAAALRTWHIGINCIVACGLFKLVVAPLGDWARRIVPRAGLLGSLAAIALILISFFPLTHILATPLPGLVALVIVLTSLIGKIPLPGRTPGTLVALVVAGLMYFAMAALGVGGAHLPPATPVTWLPSDWTMVLGFGWLAHLPDSLLYLPIVLPFALGTVVGGIDCTESAAAAGDVYDTRAVIGVEAVATLLAGLCGGVIQTTPYIGHPAYKAMGGRAAYTLATALLIGAAGLLGFFAVLARWIPAPAVYPILVFVGLEITAQTFIATPRRHFAAVAIACLPALAYLAIGLPDRIFGDSAVMGAGVSVETLGDASLIADLKTLRMLSAGFIVSGLLWAWMLAAVIDRQLRSAAWVMIVAAGCTLVGIIHSPLAGGQLYLPTRGMLGENLGAVIQMALGYAAAAGVLAAWSMWLIQQPELGLADDHTVAADLHDADV